MKKKIVFILALAIAVILCICVNVKKNSLYDDQAAKRWSDGGVSQISIFYPVSYTANMDDMHFVDLAHKIQNSLDTSAYSDEAGKKDKSGISFPYATSVMGNIDIASEEATVNVKAYGVEGDFFIFHPLYLLGGSYLSADDVMDDMVILDEEAAWKLFGSSDIVGQTVNIGGIPHLVKGVFKKEEGKLEEAAGLSGPICFTSLNSLKEYGSVYGSYSFEMIIPNPVDGFGLKTLNEVLGDAAQDKIIVENTGRYKSSRLVDITKSANIRSMSTKGVLFPYYENIARAWEDIFASIYLVVKLIFAVEILIVAVKCYRFIKSENFKCLKKDIKHRLVCYIKNLSRRGESL